MTDHDPRVEVGRRVRRLRERAGKSRATLAGLVGRSEDWLKFIETGKRGLPLAMAARLARELGVRDLSEIFGADLSAPITTVDKPVHRSAQAVAQAITEWSAWDNEPPSVDHYIAAVDRAWRSWHTSSAQRTDAALVLPELIRTGKAAVASHTNDARRTARIALAATYHLAQAYLAWQDDVKGPYWLSVDRGRQLSEDADDPVARSTAAFYAAHTLRSEGRADEALDVLRRAADEIEPRLAEGDENTRATWGLLHMCRAVTLARCNHDPSAWVAWEQADHAASGLSADYVHPSTVFGHAYVQVHRTVIAAELGDSTEALRHADAVNQNQIPSRLWGASHLIHAAWALHRQRDAAAVVPLVQAERISPETVQFSMPARQMLVDLATSARGPVRAEASDLARRLNVLV